MNGLTDQDLAALRELKEKARETKDISWAYVVGEAGKLLAKRGVWSGAAAFVVLALFMAAFLDLAWKSDQAFSGIGAIVLLVAFFGITKMLLEANQRGVVDELGAYISEIEGAKYRQDALKGKEK